MLENGGDDRRIVGEPGSGNRIRDDINSLAQVKKSECGLGDCHERYRSIETRVKIFNDLSKKFDLVRQIRELGHLRYSPPDFRQPPNQFVKVRRCNPAGAISDKFLQIDVHFQPHGGYTYCQWKAK